MEMNISLEELLQKFLSDLLEAPQSDFEKAMQYVLNKNHNLYKRLA